MGRITKEQVLKGIKARETVHVPELNGDLIVRPLTDGEFSDMNNESARISREARAYFFSQRGKSPEEIEEMVKEDENLQNLITADDMYHLKQSTYIAAAAGLSCDKEEWTVDDVRKLPQRVPDKIAKVALKMTKGDKGGDMNSARSFRKDTGGHGDSHAEQAGVSNSPGPAEPDTAPEGSTA